MTRPVPQLKAPCIAACVKLALLSLYTDPVKYLFHILIVQGPYVKIPHKVPSFSCYVVEVD